MSGSPLTPSSDLNLILTGYIGPNQLLTMRRIAERLHMALVSYERRLEEQAGLPADELRLRYGEARLKTLEAEVIDELALYRGVVMHISGETLLHSDYLHRLAATGPVICLVATLDAVLQRLHLVLGARYHDPRERAIALGQLKREWAVRSRAEVHELDTTGLSEPEIIEAVAAFWHEQVMLATRG